MIADAPLGMGPGGADAEAPRPARPPWPCYKGPYTNKPSHAQNHHMGNSTYARSTLEISGIGLICLKGISGCRCIDGTNHAYEDDEAGLEYIEVIETYQRSNGTAVGVVCRRTKWLKGVSMSQEQTGGQNFHTSGGVGYG